MASSQRTTVVEWAPWFKFEEGNRIKCVWCKATFAYKRARALAHYGFGEGSRKSRCPLAPQSVLRCFATCGGQVPKAMTYAQMYGSDAASSPATVTPLGSESAPGEQVGTQSQETRDHMDEPTNSLMERSESTMVPIGTGSESIRIPSRA